MLRRVLQVVTVAVIAAATLLSTLPTDASSATRRRVVRRGPHHRTVVVVHRGWPLRRAHHVVVVRPARVAVRVAPAVFLAPVVFTPVIVAARPVGDVLAWEDAETLDKEEDWTEFTLNADSRGRKLYIEISAGRAQIDWAEIVFENGDTQVVDFAEKTHKPGLYSLFDFRDGRRVDHVRMVARAKSDESKITLLMEK